MVEVNAGHNGDIRVNDVDRIKPSTEAYFEDDHVEPGAGKVMQNGERRKFKIGQRHLTTHRFDCRKAGAEGLVRQHLTIDASAFIKANQMR